jgi:two-component system, cell cycle response regulator
MIKQNNPKPETQITFGQSPTAKSHPLPATTASSMQQAAGTPSATKPGGNSSYSALIVDDNTSFQKLLALSLSMHPQIGVIDFADNGESAIKKAKTKQYDLVFMDAMMPGINGYDTCALLRKNKEYQHTPIIMVTGLNSPMDEAKGIIAGTSTYVTKPVQQTPFRELLNREISLLEYKKNLNNTDQ